MTDAEIEWLKSSIAAKTPLAWRDIDGGMHTVLGYIAEYKESWEEIAEPVVALPGNKVAALRNTEAECFYVMTPALDAAPASDAEPVGWQVQFFDGNWSKSLYSEADAMEFKASPRGTVIAYRPVYDHPPVTIDT